MLCLNAAFEVLRLLHLIVSLITIVAIQIKMNYIICNQAIEEDLSYPEMGWNAL